MRQGSIEFQKRFGSYGAVGICDYYGPVGDDDRMWTPRYSGYLIATYKGII